MVIVGTRPRRPGATGTSPGTGPSWVWRDPDSFGAAVVSDGLWVAWLHIWIVVALFNPDVGGSPLRGTVGLVISLALVAWLGVRLWRRRTELHPSGFRVVRTWSTRTIPWSDVSSFAGHSVFTRAGAKVPLPGIKDAKHSGLAAARFNQLCGVVEARVDNPRGLVEVPTSTSIDRGMRPGRSGVLHATDTGEAPLCRSAVGPCVPTFLPWRAQDLGCLAALRSVRRTRTTGAALAGPVRALHPAGTARARARVGAIRHSRRLLGGRGGLAPLRRVGPARARRLAPYRFLRISTTVGPDGLVVRSFLRTRARRGRRSAASSWRTRRTMGTPCAP